jgi:DNA-sulfur modification-associated
MTTVDLDNIEDIGTTVSGLVVDENRFVAVMPFARLMNLVTNPLQASNPKLRETSSQLADYYELHAEIQRAFDKGKKDNAELYAEYVIQVQKGENGDTPTIDLYTPEKLTVFPGTADQKAKLIWTHGLTVVPYDGETQLAARFLGAAREADTKKMHVVVTITHGKPVAYARQCFHDRNAYQRKAPVAVSMAMDARDPLIAVVRSIEEKVPTAKGQISWRSRQLPQTGGYIAAASFLRTAVVCFAHGIGGVQLREADLPTGMSSEDFTRRAVLWFGKVIEKVGPYMRDRENYVASSPAIWAALGAMGKPLVESNAADTASLQALVDGLAARLDRVDWRKSDAWVGVAVKQTPKGFSFAGGAKDSGSIAFKALNDGTDANFARIRAGGRQAA